MRRVNRVASIVAGAFNAAGRRARGFVALGGESVRRGLSAAKPRMNFLGRLRDLAGNRAGTARARPLRRLSWPLRLLLVASLAVPLLLLAIAAWQNFRLVRIQAEQRVMAETGQLHEHVLSALEIYTLVLAWIDDRIRGLEWDRIEHDENVHRLLAEIETLPQISSVAIIDPSGQVRASGRLFPATAADASTLDAFVAQKQRDADIFIGREHSDERTSTVVFDISRRRSTPDGSFGGVIAVSATPEYFSDFFSTLSQDRRFSASVMRSDGTVLVRYPSLPQPLVFSPDRPVMKAIAASPDRGLFWGDGWVDGIGRLLGYQRVGAYPLYVVFGIPADNLLVAWRANLINYLLFAIPASLGLFCMTLFAVRQLQQQKVASWRWRTTAGRLKREMNRRTRAETALHQAQKMEALGQLTGGVAHDFNNLLAVLQGCIELLSGRQRDPRLEARVEMALATVQRGEKLTRQLLAFARRQPLTVARLDLNDVLRGMAELLSRTAGSKVSVETDLAPDLWLVDADATQLELAVINLAINSRDAMPQGGVLRVRTFNAPQTARISEGEPSVTTDFVGLEISDTGIGMPPETLARAFEPFFTSKEPGKGTGLGLSMVYGFARQLGGSASIRSEVGRGTAVTLLLPRAPEAGAAEGQGMIGLPSDAPA